MHDAVCEAASSGSHLICVCNQETLLADTEGKRVYQEDLNTQNRRLHYNCSLERHVMPATCRQIEFTPVLSRDGDATLYNQ